MCFIQAVLILLYYKKSIMEGMTSSQAFKDLYVRSSVGFIGNTLMIVTTSMLPLSILNIITSTNAFWAAVLGYYIVGDVLNRKEILAMMLGFIGIYLIVRNKDPPTDTTLADQDKSSS